MMLKKMYPERCGFQPQLRNEHFLCAFITYDKQYSYGRVAAVKRHMTSQEVFVLLQGSATLLVADGSLKKREIVTLQPQTAYCVEAGTWHYLAISEDARLFVTESNDVTAQNTETMYLEEPYEILSGLSTT